MGQQIVMFVLEGMLYFSLVLKDHLILDKNGPSIGFFFCNYIITFYFAAVLEIITVLKSIKVYERNDI
jgi:hypothetical protein